MYVIRSFTISILQFSDPVFLRVLIKAILLSFFVFMCLAGLVWFFLSETSFFNFWFFEIITDVLGGISVLFITWLLFPGVALFFVTLFLDDIVDAVENRHYQNDLSIRNVAFSKMIIVSLRFSLITLALNILALPFYVLTIWFPPFTLVIFYCLNGYLLGREYYELIALRHLDPTKIVLIRKANKWILFMVGVGITFLFSIPIINMLAPVIGVAVMTHVFRSLKTDSKELTN